MKAIQVTCPNCGGKLRADETTSVVNCEYCGQASTIQRRTRILERVMPPPQASGKALRYAKQSHSSRWVLLFVFVPILGGIVAAILGVRAAVNTQRAVRRQVDQAMATAQQQIESATREATGAAAAANPANRPASWQGTNGVLLADIDGDGTPELIGRGRKVNAGDIVMLIAMDLKTGTLKWQSPPLGTYTDTYRGLLTIAGDKLVYISEQAKAHAFQLKDGTPSWTITLDERIKAFCVGDTPETFQALGNDDKLRTIAIADGTIGATKPIAKKRSWSERPACKELMSDDTTPFESYKTPGSLTTERLNLGIDVDAVIEGPGGRIASGSRSTGTRVTTLVALDDKNHEKWRATAAAEALAADGAPRHVVVGETATCFVYYGAQYRLGCLAMVDGKRLWDIEAPTAYEGLYIVGDALVVTTHRGLEVFELATGANRWKMD